MVTANRVVASDWMEGSVVVSVAGERRSVIEGILTCVIGDTGGHSRERVEWRKEGIRLINYNL
jgi:hypothetical protein